MLERAWIIGGSVPRHDLEKTTEKGGCVRGKDSYTGSV